MKIISAYYTDKPGGFCKRLYQLLNACVANGLETHYCSLDKPPNNLDSKVIFHQIPFVLKARKGLVFWTIFSLWCPLYLLFTCLKIRPNRIVVFGSYYSTMFLLSKFFIRCPVHLFLRSLVFKINKLNQVPAILQVVSNLLEKVGIINATTIVCMSNSMRQELENFLGYKLENTQLLANNIPKLPTKADSKLACPYNKELLGPDTLVVLSAGVLDDRKNILYAIEACLPLSCDSDTQKVILLVAGVGPELERYKKLVIEAEAKNIIFLGWIKKLEEVFAYCHVLLHPAKHEGQPNTIMEALSFGLTVLAADVPELREILEFDNLLFDLDNPNNLSRILANLKPGSEALLEMHKHCQMLKARFDFDWNAKALSIIKS